MQDRLGAYKLLREVGRGATATVYEAEHGVLGCKVAIKILRPPLSADSRGGARFAREEHALLQLEAAW
jgi:serine/threonine-protein kinase